MLAGDRSGSSGRFGLVHGSVSAGDYGVDLFEVPACLSNAHGDSRTGTGSLSGSFVHGGHDLVRPAGREIRAGVGEDHRELVLVLEERDVGIGWESGLGEELLVESTGGGAG